MATIGQLPMSRVEGPPPRKPDAKAGPSIALQYADKISDLQWAYEGASGQPHKANAHWRTGLSDIRPIRRLYLYHSWRGARFKRTSRDRQFECGALEHCAT